MGKDWYEGCWRSAEWRLNHLYFINSKSDGVVRFRMNWAQDELFHRLWTRNQVLKARQLGMSTFTAMLMLDCCLFRANFEAGIIDKTLPDAREKLRKIKLAYEWMLNPPVAMGRDHVDDEGDREEIAKYALGIAKGKLDGAARAAEISAEKADFANGSKIRIGTNLRGGTMNLLHVSEFGYVARAFPQRADDILQGGLNTVPKDQIVIMESTHEGGKYGENYRLVKAAMEAQGRELDDTDFRFFFFPWWKQAEYSLPRSKADTSELNDYWHELEKRGIELSDAQKRWYASQCKVFGALIKREYPSTPEEALSNPASGAIYAAQIEALRAAGKIAAEFEADDLHPLYISWDLGGSDYTAMWLFQPGGDGKYYVLDYFCASGQKIPFYVQKAQQWERQYGQLIARHILPHDARQERLESVASVERQLRAAGFKTSVLPRVKNTWDGIFATRDVLGHCVFHERCSREVVVETEVYMSGVDALENYKTGGVGSNGVERSEPLHDACSHGADAFRYFAEAIAAGIVSREGARAQERMEPLVATRQEVEKNVTLGRPAWW